ncbi:trigger factor [Aeromicrobium sp. CTD01-1L150]|uniref:trigger factor n=1 Tax=Aeromicrobium sp. CTD01-1L150 TaxID=3341830 RepID=UPI0035C01BB9
MKSTTESLSPTRVKLTIEVPFEEFKPSLDEAYKTIGSQIQVPGFRKGKVPAVIVDQRIGRAAVLDEAINKALPDWYRQAVEETKIQPLSQPEIDLTKFDDGEDIEVTAELDVRPELTLPDLSTISVSVPDAEVTDADVDEQIEALRERFATTTDVERAAADGDALTINLVAKDKDGEAIEGAEADGMPYTVGSGVLLEGLDEAVTGLSAGEEVTFSTELVGGELKGTPVDVTVQVVDVKERSLPDVDEEFVQTASEFDTVDEFKDDVRERLVRGKRMEQANEARDLVLDEVIGKVEAPLPDSLVDEELNGRREQIAQQLAQAGLTMENYLEDEGQTAEEFEAELERRTRDSIVAQFVLDQIVQDDELGIEDAELSQHIIQRAQQSGQDPNAYVQHIMEHNHVPEMVSEVLRGKALASLVEGVTVTDESGNDLRLAELRGDGSYAEESDEDEDGESEDS